MGRITRIPGSDSDIIGNKDNHDKIVYIFVHIVHNSGSYIDTLSGKGEKKGKGCGDAGRVGTVNGPQNDPLAFYLTR